MIGNLELEKNGISFFNLYSVFIYIYNLSNNLFSYIYNLCMYLFIYLSKKNRQENSRFLG